MSDDKDNVDGEFFIETSNTIDDIHKMMVEFATRISILERVIFTNKFVSADELDEIKKIIVEKFNEANPHPSYPKLILKRRDGRVLH